MGCGVLLTLWKLPTPGREAVEEAGGMLCLVKVGALVDEATP